MGTRGAIGVVINGTAKLAYNHFDSYPDGLGQELVDFLLTLDLFTMDGQRPKFEALKRNALELKAVPDKTPPTPAQQKYYAPYADLSVSKQSLTDWYCLLRNFQGVDMLKGLVGGILKDFEDNSDFPKDSLFCEWAYVLDLDTETLEVYKGFQHRAHKKGRWAISKKPADWKPSYKGQSFYYPCKLLASIPLNKLEKGWKKFLTDEKKRDEKENAAYEAKQAKKKANT